MLPAPRSPLPASDSVLQLLALQKLPGNNTCCDCSAPAPQWASPKFGVFICLTCAGVHRGLGVHISFVRSVTMDAFKGEEMARMEKGGNNRWKEYCRSKRMLETGGGEGGIKERYEDDAAANYKDMVFRSAGAVAGGERERGLTERSCS